MTEQEKQALNNGQAGVQEDADAVARAAAKKAEQEAAAAKKAEQEAAKKAKEAKKEKAAKKDTSEKKEKKSKHVAAKTAGTLAALALLLGGGGIYFGTSLGNGGWADDIASRFGIVTDTSKTGEEGTGSGETAAPDTQEETVPTAEVTEPTEPEETEAPTEPSESESESEPEVSESEPETEEPSTEPEAPPVTHFEIVVRVDEVYVNGELTEIGTLKDMILLVLGLEPEITVTDERAVQETYDNVIRMLKSELNVRYTETDTEPGT
ncbi:MAG: hypothetical protein J6U26_00795, partial [Lachnospiraceae bacterium]|nr:hypothetical protein [Lachnospiraceae bacterium]